MGASPVDPVEVRGGLEGVEKFFGLGFYAVQNGSFVNWRQNLLWLP
jgi:hypothetical protein